MAEPTIDDLVRLLGLLVEEWGVAALTVTVPELWLHSGMESLGPVRLVYAKTTMISFSILTKQVQLRYSFDPTKLGLPVEDVDDAGENDGSNLTERPQALASTLPVVRDADTNEGRSPTGRGSTLDDGLDAVRSESTKYGPVVGTDGRLAPSSLIEGDR